MPTAHNEIPARLYAGLYVGTQRERRFWGWSSQGWGSLRNADAERPVKNLAAWLRLAHERLDGDRPPEKVRGASTTQDSYEPQPQQRSRKSPRLQFVCNRHMIGLLIR